MRLKVGWGVLLRLLIVSILCVLPSCREIGCNVGYTLAQAPNIFGGGRGNKLERFLRTAMAVKTGSIALQKFFYFILFIIIF